MSVILALCAFATLGASTVKADSTVITSKGASVRLIEPTGIKFGAEISAVNENATYGFAIVPDYYLTKKNITENYIPALIDAYTVDGIILLASIPVEGEIYGSVGNILEENFGLTFAGIPYEKIDDSYTYGDVIYASVLDVSTKLLNKYYYEEYPLMPEDIVIIDEFMAKALEKEGKELTISIDSEKTLGLDETVTLEATTDLDKEFIVWKSDNPDVATVENGVVTAKSSGVANVTANIAGVSSTCVIKVVPDVVDISLDNAVPREDPDYRLTRAAAEETYVDRTAIKFTGTNEALWRNNLLINIADYRADYEWIVVDFYFNSDDVRFNTVSAGYVTLPFGVCCTNGAFYAVNFVDGEYHSVPAVKGWNTIAFKIDEMKCHNDEYLDAIMLGAVDTYVANIRAMTAKAMPEIIVPSNILDNSNIYLYNNYATGGINPMTRYDNVAVFGKTDLVQIVGGANATWHNAFEITGLSGLNTLKTAGYRYLAVDIMFQSQGVTGTVPNFLFPAADWSPVPLNGSPAIPEIMLFDAAHQSTTLKDNTWTTFVFDLSATDKDNIQAYASGACNWYISDCYAMTEGEFTAWKVAPEKLEVEVAGLTTKNITKAVVDGVGGRDGVVQCTGTGTWYDNVVFIPIAQMPNEVYTTFSFDVYLSKEASLYFYFLSSDANSIAMGSGSIDGIQILDADGNEAVLATNTWLTVKLDLTKMGYAAPQFFASIEGQVMTIDNAYFA